MFTQPPTLHLPDLNVFPLYDRIIAFLGIRLSLDPSSRPSSSPSNPSPRLRASSRSRRSLGALLQGSRPPHGSRVFTGKASPAQLAPTTVVMHCADVKRLLERLLAVPPSTRSLLVTQTHIDGSTDDTPLTKSSHVPQPDTESLLDVHPNPSPQPTSLSGSNSPKDPVPSGAGVNTSSIVPESSVIQTPPNYASSFVPSSDSSHSDAMPPIGESASISTPPNSQSFTPSAPPPPIPIPASSSRSSSSRPFDPNTFEPRSARRPSQHALGFFSPLRQSWTSDDLFEEGTVFEEEDAEDDTMTKMDDVSTDLECKWVICGEDEDEDELDDVNQLIEFFESRGRSRTTKARCDAGIGGVGAGANVTAYVQLAVS